MDEINNQKSSGSDSSGSDEGARSFGEVQEREIPNDGSKIQDKPVEKSQDDQGKDSQPEEDKSQDKSSEEGEQKLTEKGTKLDPNPQSAINQQLANERKVRSQMEGVLANPTLLAQFMKEQYGIEVPTGSGKQGPKEATQQAPEFKEYKAEDLESLDDVAGVINGLQKTLVERTEKYESDIQQLNTAVSQLLQGGETQRIATTMTDDVGYLRKQPELDSNSPDFIEGLEQDIAEEYHKLDFDETTGRYRGTYTLKQIGERMLGVARKASKKGSSTAQTVVKDKTRGRIDTSPEVKGDEDKDEDLNPSDSIAQGISKMFGNK